jgi:iron complex outermembrane receptor protein
MKKLFFILLLGCIIQAAFTQETEGVETPNESASDSASTDGASTDALDFVVTASRTSESASKVPGQLSVITADDIAKSGLTRITDILQTVPGIRVARDRNGGGIDVSMRGIASDYGNGKVLIIVDGMRLNHVQGKAAVNWGAINLSEVERIEVLDGGASVQYGDNAQVGVINIITKKSGEAKTDISVSGGSFLQNEQRFSHHQPADWGGFTVSGGHWGTQGYQNHTGNDTGNAELQGIFDINDTMSLHANIGFAATNGLFANTLTKDQFDDDPTQNPSSGTSSNSTSSFSNSDLSAGLGFAWAINEIFNFDMPVSYSWKNLKWDMRLTAPSSPYIAYRSPQMVGVRPKITTALKPADMPLRISGGVDVLFAFSEIRTSNAPDKETNFHIQNLSETTIGPWAMINFEPLSFLALNAGMRYDTAFVNGHLDEWTGTVSGSEVTRQAEDASTRWDAFVYEAGVTVNPLDFLKVYAKYGTQFRYPYLDDFVFFNPGNFITTLNTSLEPEKGWTAEGGIGVHFKEFVKFNANLYFLKIDNEIAVYPTSPTARLAVNMDPIERLGTDIGLTLTPLKYVELDMNYGFVNAKFSEGPFKDNFVPLAAKHILSGSLVLHTPFGLSLGPDILYKSEMYMGLDNANAQPMVDSSIIWGLQARYVINKFKGPLAIQLTIHNLADTKYASLVYYTQSSDSTSYFVDNNMGRSVNLSLQYSL